MPNRVFIISSRSDLQVAERIYRDLGIRGIDCFFDTRDFTFGDNHKESIRSAIQDSQVVILILSSNTIHSNRVREEINFALEQGKRILPLVAGEVNFEDIREFNNHVSQLNWLPIREGIASVNYEKVVETIRSIIKSKEGKEHYPQDSTDFKLPSLTEFVRFSTFAPPVVKPKSQFLLSIWAYLEEDRDEAIDRAGRKGKFVETGTKGPVEIARGESITICVDIPGFQLGVTTDTIVWNGEIANASFPVSVPDSTMPGDYLGQAKILQNGFQIARLDFEINVGQEELPAHELKTKMQPIKSAFASYASEDRVDVLGWARGARSVGVKVFLDVLSLREGEDWEGRLSQEIQDTDLFCLFWSKAASKSPWVEREWRFALAAKGLDYIHPVPLVDPRKVRIPPELGAHKHFNDLTRIVIEYEKSIRGTG